MSVKITILYDNRCDNAHLQEGWGFSALVETEKEKILFDTGGDYPAFTTNAEKLKLPFETITHLVFSHRHWDHISGFQDIVTKVKMGTALYVPRTFPWLLRRKASHLKTRVVHTFEEIAPNCFSLVLKGGFFLYEQALILKTPEGLGVLTGCAHPGIVNIIKEAQKKIPGPIAFVMGGFHLLFHPGAYCADVVKQFQALGVKKVAPCHCSGDHLIRQFQETYGANYRKVGTGTVLHF